MEFSLPGATWQKVRDVRNSSSMDEQQLSEQERVEFFISSRGTGQFPLFGFPSSLPVWQVPQKGGMTHTYAKCRMR